MTTLMTSVDQENHVLHCLLIDLTLGNVTYYLSNAYKPITTAGHTYTALGAFISVSSITEDLRTTNGDISITLTGIPTNDNYLSRVLTMPIKGGSVKLRRAFFNSDTLDILPDQVFLRYQGIVTNFAIEEEDNLFTGDLNNTISIICASLNSLLENKTTGQRTNGSDRRKYYPGDISFDRVKDIANASFDFGRKSNMNAFAQAIARGMGVSKLK